MTEEGAKRRVFIVEDEALVAMLIEDVLGELGYEVVAIAGRLERARDLAETVICDLAVIDVNLNGERTFPVAEVLRRRGVPLVFATGYGAEGLDEEWRHAPLLQKPFQPHELEAAIGRAMAR